MSLLDMFRRRGKQPAGASLHEAFTSDPDERLSAAQMGARYVRRLTQDVSRDLDPLTQQRMQDVAYYLYDNNPLAKRILELTRDFVLGEGVEVAASDEMQGSILDNFWHDAINQMDLKLHARVLELGLWGEQCWSVVVNPIDGHVRLGYIDPGAISSVIRDPHDAEQVVAVVLKSGPGQADRRYRVVSLDEDPRSSTYGRLTGVTLDSAGNVVTQWQELDAEGRPVGEAKAYAGACFFFKINAVATAARGRSDLLALADWLDAYDQVLFNEVDRALLLKSFVWDVTLQGADQTAIDAYAKSNPAPKPGSVRYHNDKVDWEAETPDLKAVDAQAGADILLSYIAAGSGHPKTWLAGTLDVNRASAQELAEPAVKRIASRQLYLRYMIERVLTFVLDQAELHGRLPRRKTARQALPEPWALTVSMPTPWQRDMKSAADTLVAAANALIVARGEGAIDMDVVQQVLVALISGLGVDVDAKEMRERLAVEKAERDERTLERPSTPFPPGESVDR